jgi:hypothetical protein
VASAQAPFYDDYNGYAVGSQIHGQGSWHEWDGVLHAGVSKIEDNSSGFARSGNSLSLDSITAFSYAGTTDMVHEFTGWVAGQQTMRAYVYHPSSMIEKIFWLGMNTYSIPGPYDWSVQLTMDGATGVWTVDAGSAATAQGPLVLDAWVEVKTEIDLTANLATVFYNGAATAPAYSWTGGVFGGGAGALNVSAVDLYHAVSSVGGSNRGYYDDFGLTKGFDVPTSNYCVGKTNSQGCTPAISANGFAHATAGSGPFVISSVNERFNKPHILLYSQAQQAVGFFGGTLCVGGGTGINAVRRTVGFQSGGVANSPDCLGIARIDMNAFAQGALGGLPQAYLVVPGTVINCQMWGRDNGFPQATAASLSDALTYTVGS